MRYDKEWMDAWGRFAAAATNAVAANVSSEYWENGRYNVQKIVAAVADKMMVEWEMRSAERQNVAVLERRAIEKTLDAGCPKCGASRQSVDYSRSSRIAECRCGHWWEMKLDEQEEDMACKGKGKKGKKKK